MKHNKLRPIDLISSCSILILFLCVGCQPRTTTADMPLVDEPSSNENLAVEAIVPDEDESVPETTPADNEMPEPVLRVGDLLAAESVENSESEGEGEPPSDEGSIDNEVQGSDEPLFEIGNELTITTLQAREIQGSEITFEQTLASATNYAQYIVSYLSEGYRINGLLTIPLGDPPLGGFKAVVFNHGFIPPSTYRTAERYTAYVDALARSGLVVFKIDMRGHDQSEGEATGTYFSPDYTVDAISALKSLQTLSFVDQQGIGMWGHSMAGNLVMRAMLIEPDVKVAVLWGGAVYSYDDYTLYSIADPSAPREFLESFPGFQRGQELRDFYGEPDTSVPYWQAVSLTENLATLQAPIQLHHANDDDVVNVGYSIDLAAILAAEGKIHEFYQYDGGGHNIGSPYFTEAMQRTIAFFLANL